MNVNYDNLDLSLAAIASEKILSLDTETFGLNSFKNDELFSIIISIPGTDYYFNFKNYLDEKVTGLGIDVFWKLKPILADESKTWFLTNAKFDMHMLAREGLFITGKIYDLYFLDRLHFNQHMKYSLDAISGRWGEEKLDIVMKYITDHDLKTFVEYPELNKSETLLHFDRVPFSIIQPYGEADGRATLETGIKILEDLKAKDAQIIDDKIPKQMQVVEMESRLVHTLFRMEQRGVKLDIAYCKEALSHYLNIMNEATHNFKAITGVDFVKGTTVFEEVFASEKDKWEQTEAGNWKWDKDIMATFDNPAARIAQDYAEAKKQSEYFANFLHYSGNGIIHTNFQQAGTVTGRLSSRDPNCLSLDTEILTRAGWVNSDSISFNHEIANYDLDTGEIFWSKPSAIFKSEFKNREMVEFFNEHIKWRLTADHIVVNKNRKSGKISTTNAASLPLDCHILHSGYNKNLEYNITDDMIKFCVAVQADGHFVGQKIRFVFKKKRKKDRLLDILKFFSVNYKFSEKMWSGSVHYEIIVTRPFLPLITNNKTFSKECLELSLRQCSLFLEELKFWDGSSTRENFDYCSVLKENIDVIQAVAALSGYRAHVYKHSSKSSDAFVISFVRRNYSGTANLIKKVEEVKEQVWCVSVSSKFIVARRNGDTFITGNCQNLTNPDKYETEEAPELYSVRKSFIPREGFFFALIDYSQVEFRILLDIAGANSLINEVLNGHDVHTATANVSGTTRKEAKTTNFLTAYGGGVVKLAQNLYETKGSKSQLGVIYKQMFGWRLSDAEKLAEPTVTQSLRDHNTPLIRKAYDIQQSIFRAAPEIKDLLKSVQRTAENRGYVRNWLGRRYQFNDKRWCYRAPNHLIQGAAAEVIKIAMNRVDDLLMGCESKMILTIHDELIFEIKFGEEHLVDKIKEIMESVYPYNRLPLLVDVEYSYTNLCDKSAWPPEHLSNGAKTGDSI